MIKPVIDGKQLETIGAAKLFQKSFFENIHVDGGDASENKSDDLSLEKVHLEGVTLNQVEIKEFSVLDSIFTKCSFAGAVIEQSHLVRLEIQSTRLQGIQLTELRAIDTSFFSSKLNDANFRYSKLKNVLFKSCDLNGIDFIGANLKNVVFEECDLTNSNFSQTQLDNVSFSSSKIIDMIISPEAIKEVFVDTGQALYLSSIFGLKIKD
jgi:uncharacterized protein YjbI with pentapeptide repeats